MEIDTEVVEGLREGDRVVTAVSDNGKKEAAGRLAIMSAASLAPVISCAMSSKPTKRARSKCKPSPGFHWRSSGANRGHHGGQRSGKSTLMNMLGCLDQPTSGDYLLGWRERGRAAARQLARLRNRKLGFVFSEL